MEGPQINQDLSSAFFFHLINQSRMFGGESNQVFLSSDRIVCVLVAAGEREERGETVVVFSH